MKKLMLSLFIAFGFSACSLSNDDMNNVDCGVNTEVAFTGFPLLCNYAVKSLPTNPAAIVVNSTERMEYYFTKHENTCTVASDPNIDFTQKFLVGIFAGAKPTSGYAIKITSIVENNCQIVINFYEKSPQNGETLSSAPTYPSDFILIPKTSKPIVFNRTTESSDNIVIGSFNSKCIGTDCQKFFQLNNYNIQKFQNVVAGNYDFSQYKYSTTTKRDEYTTFSKSIPTEILNLKGQTKTYGTPDSADQGGIYFEFTQGAVVTKIYIDNADTADQSTEVKLFKKTIQDKITSLK
ncbi:protease complex subunit PrcB family protein [Flavobacterium sp. MDT1-60]|uniref:protease complex subunit PrcB family protein n=1 Tax=Flavobacterium sp. MDT1-60 TaxID=1979344 RepID=UPI00177C35B9|nr:protease complex subunit PrcB family protein [Flavobacterium sp. MDT1-60]QOG03997.1 protease complex subunit PrcB family protein [Flavobacterium sp. MDT1-60]